MSLKELIEKEKQFLALTGTLQSSNLFDTLFKIFSVKKILSEFISVSEIYGEDIIIALEEFPVPYSHIEIFKLIESTGVLKRIDENTYKIAGELSISHLFREELSSQPINISIPEYIQNLKKFDESEGTIGVRECITTVCNTGEWAYEIILKSDLDTWHGIPVFWNCQNGEHTPVGILPGPFATIDTALLVLEGIHFGFMPSSSSEKTELLKRLFNEIHQYQLKSPAYDRGGFFVHNDNDFPMAECPIVDTTAEALFALLLLLKYDNHARKSGNSIIDDRQAVISEINDGIDFLMTMQCEDGSWGLYRYEVKPDFKYTTLPRDFSCMLTAEALICARRSGVVYKKKVKEIDDAIDRLVAFLLGTARQKEDMVFWTTNFSEKDEETKDSVNVTTKIAHILMIIMEALPDYRVRLEKFVISSAKYIEMDWMPNRTNMAKLEFRVPTRKGLYATFMTWEQPADALIVSFLLEYAAKFNYRFNEKTWDSINRAIFNFINTNKHGHWSDLLLNKTAFPSNTLYFHRALLSYLYYLKERDICAFEISCSSGGA